MRKVMVLAGMLPTVMLTGGTQNVNDLAGMKAIGGLLGLFMAIASAYGIFIIIKNCMELFPAIQQQDSTTIGSAVKGLIGGIFLAGISGVLAFLGFTV